MTVIDESENSDEYADMEFVEFLEFLVRIAYQQYLIDENKHIAEKLTDFLREILVLVNFPYVEPPITGKTKKQANDDDINALSKYIVRNDYTSGGGAAEQ